MEKDYTDIIRQYHYGLLSEAARRDFEQEKAVDPELAAETATYSALLQARDRALRADMQALGKKILRSAELDQAAAPSVARKRSLTWVWAAAAALLVLVVAVWVIPFGKTTTSPTALLYEKYYAPMTFSGTLGTVPPDAMRQQWQQAVQAYEQKNYAEALARVAPLRSDAVYQDQAALLEGMVHLEQKKATDAIAAFDRVRSEVPLYRRQADWYRALALLQADQAQAATSALQAIAGASEHPYKGKAAQLLREL